MRHQDFSSLEWLLDKVFTTVGKSMNGDIIIRESGVQAKPLCNTNDLNIMDEDYLLVQA